MKGNYALVQVQPWEVKNQIFTDVTNALSQIVLQRNTKRKYLLIQNESAKDIYVSIGQVAVALQSLLIPGGGNWEPYIPPAGAIHIIGTGAVGQRVLVLEGV